MNKQLIEIIEKKYGVPFEGYGHTYCIDGVDIIDIAEEYSTSQTEPLKKEIEELKEKIERVKNVLNDCVSRDSAVWTINTAREILYKD